MKGKKVWILLMASVCVQAHAQNIAPFLHNRDREGMPTKLADRSITTLQTSANQSFTSSSGDSEVASNNLAAEDQVSDQDRSRKTIAVILGSASVVVVLGLTAFTHRGRRPMAEY